MAGKASSSASSPSRGGYVSVAVPTPLRRTFQYADPGGQAQRGMRVRVPFGGRRVLGVVLGRDEAAQVEAARIKEVEETLEGGLPETLLKLCEWAAGYYAHPIGEVLAAALPALVRQGREARLPAQAPGSAFTLTAVRQPNLRLTDEQQVFIDSVGDTGAHLLQGITGSGKTEVYLRLVERALQAGRQTLVLVPEIGLTPQTVGRFRERFDVELAVLHSGLSDKERALAWLQAARGQAGIVLGTRSAVFTPLARPGLIIVDEEHDGSFKQQEGFHYNARDLAVLRGQLESMPVILGSATPSLESLANAQRGRYGQGQLSRRPASLQRERYEIINTAQLPVTDGLSHPLREAIAATIAAGNQALLFINRRGYAPALLCTACGWVASCRHCDARLTYHARGPAEQARLYCHHCGSAERRLDACHACQSGALKLVGAGTQRVEQRLRALFGEAPVLRIDRDSTRRAGALAEAFAEVGKGGPAILVGTQMLAKGHHFPRVTLVALLDIDPAFYTADFRALERLGQTILQVGGRAGRADQPGKVLVQTGLAQHPLLRLLLEEGYAPFAEALLAERRAQGLPPYSFDALIRASSPEAEGAVKFLLEVAGEPGTGPAKALGPVPALMERKAGRYRQHLLLRAPSRAALHQLLAEKVRVAEAIKAPRSLRWSVDVDPYDLF